MMPSEERRVTAVEQAVELLEKSNVDLDPDLLPAGLVRRLLEAYARAQKLAGYGVASLSRKQENPELLAKVTGTSVGRARETLATGKVLADSGELAMALQQGHVSLDQATEIARAEASAPGAARDLVRVAKTESFQVLKDKARAVKLDAEQSRGLAERQRAARFARSHTDEIGMVHLHLSFEPHVGTPIVNRAEAEAGRLYREAKKKAHDRSALEPFERFLADAYAKLLTGSGKGRAKRPELVVLVSHSVAKRGWKDVRKGEVCKIPGVGPVSPRVAREIANDAFLSGVFYDGKDLHQLKRWTRNTPVEVRVALELGPPPDFDGVRCVDCGNRFHPEADHVEPHVAGGPASNGNLDWRCWGCHKSKTERDRRAGKLRPPDP